MTEDELSNAIIEWARGRDMEIEIEPEAHYNYYGDRGVADLFIRERYRTKQDTIAVASERIFEFKSDYAIQQATGANEIIRQFNRMRTYFFKDESRDQKTVDAQNTVFELCFEATPTCLRHVWENQEQYQACAESARFPNQTAITFRPPDPDKVMPILARDLWDDAKRVNYINSNPSLPAPFVELYEELML